MENNGLFIFPSSHHFSVSISASFLAVTFLTINQRVSWGQCVRGFHTRFSELVAISHTAEQLSPEGSCDLEVVAVV